MDPHILNLTLLTSLRTGNIILDLIIAAMVPTLLARFWQQLSQQWYQLIAVVKRWQDARTTVYRRHIAHTKTTPFDMDSEDGANHVLQNAIRMYIGSQLPAEYLRGKVKLSEIKSGGGAAHYNPYADSDDEGNNANNEAEGGEKAKGALSNGGIKVLNLPDTVIAPVEIMPGLLFTENLNMDDQPESDEEKRSSQTKISELIYTLISPGHKGKSGKEIVDNFIKTVLEWYSAEVAKREDDSRWMYQPLVASKGSDRLYKRYQLSSDKTFNSLFFNDKARVIRVLDAFTNKTGKYKIKGFPHRLSMLFHGPPGTGKTSLVKAIATYTKRHVVSVPLSRMKTNQEFMDVMMDCVFKYCVAGGKKDDNDDGGENSNTKRAQLSYESVVFLLEDVDAASTVVHRKKQAVERNTESSQQQQQPKQASAEAPTQAAESHAAEDEQATMMGREATAAFPELTIDTSATAKGDEDEEETPKSPVPSVASPVADPSALAANKVESVSAAGSDSDSDSDASDAKSGKAKRRREKQAKSEATTEHLAKMCQMLIQQNQMANAKNAKGTFSFGDFLMDGDEDTLSLESILTVLDGVIDTPGRILVMTTNHPEKLDPALIRNGRINMKLYMGHLNSFQVEQMAAHYYPEADKLGVFGVVEAFKTLGTTESARDAAAGVVSTTKISPAEFEQMCAECVEIRDLEGRLIEMGRTLKTPA